ncbi:UBX domain-containing protein [Pseudozyma hubeiensis]|nr:UBX domain-containing protein [Pseudozyma hubeiensis]
MSSSSPASSSTPTREIRVFLPPSTASSSTSTSTPAVYPPLPLDDLKPTASELSHAFRSSPLLRPGPDAPLLTRALREKEEARLGLHSSRNRSYPSIRIRIRFSDRTMIESTFDETDTIDSVYSFLHDALDDEARRKNVVIYTSPPRVEYRKDDKKCKGKSLRELGLIPSAVVNLRWDEAEMNAGAYRAPLRKDLLEKATPLPVPSQAVEPKPETQEGAPAAEAKPAKPVPKWLKNIKSDYEERGEPAKRQRLTPPSEQIASTSNGVRHGELSDMQLD